MAAALNPVTGCGRADLVVDAQLQLFAQLFDRRLDAFAFLLRQLVELFVVNYLVVANRREHVSRWRLQDRDAVRGRKLLEALPLRLDLLLRLLLQHQGRRRMFGRGGRAFIRTTTTYKRVPSAIGQVLAGGPNHHAEQGKEIMDDENPRLITH